MDKFKALQSKFYDILGIGHPYYCRKSEETTKDKRMATRQARRKLKIEDNDNCKQYAEQED